MVVTPLAKMKSSSTFRFIFMATVCAAFVNLPAADEKRAQPFVSYEEPVASYLKRIQKGKQQHAFHPAVDVAAWQKSARAALVKLIGLGQMRDELAGFEVKVSQGKHNTVDGVFTRRLCTIETEPGIRVPFYYLVPTGKQRPMALFIAPHGHDKIGLHSYAGAFRNKKHREEILAREGHIAAQAARRGFVAIAPATRGLANEVLVPDPKGRHGNRPCRAQLVHCLLSGRTPTAERVWDMQRILDWAVKQPEVDPKKIIMTGNSGGGVLTAYTAAIDTRVTVAIPSCSFTSVTSVEGYVFHCDCCLVPGLRNWGDWKELAGLIAPRRLLLVHGEKDGLHHRPTVDALGREVKTIFGYSGSAAHTALKWGTGGHRFYPEYMWPFIAQAFEPGPR